MKNDLLKFMASFSKLKFENEIQLWQKPRKDIVNWGYESIYTEDVGRIDGRLGKDRIISEQGIAMIWLSVRVNPNGITGEDDVGKVYIINYQLKANVRLYRCRHFNNVVVLKFYDYGRTIEEIIAKFEEFLGGRYHDFINDPKLNRKVTGDFVLRREEICQ